MGGFFGGGPSTPAPDTSLADKQSARMDEQRAELERQNASRRRLLAGRGGAGSRLLRFTESGGDDTGAAGGTTALLGG